MVSDLIPRRVAVSFSICSVMITSRHLQGSGTKEYMTTQSSMTCVCVCVCNTMYDVVCVSAWITSTEALWGVAWGVVWATKHSISASKHVDHGKPLQMNTYTLILSTNVCSLGLLLEVSEYLLGVLLLLALEETGSKDDGQVVGTHLVDVLVLRKSAHHHHRC